MSDSPRETPPHLDEVWTHYMKLTRHPVKLGDRIVWTIPSGEVTHFFFHERRVRGTGDEHVRLCVDSLHPIDHGNYDGPVHCTAHPEGHACVTALYERVPLTTVTDAERHGEPEVPHV